MKKIDLIRAIARDTGYTMADIRIVLDSQEKIVHETIGKEKIYLMEGLILDSVLKAAHECKDPFGNLVDVPEKKVPRAKLGRSIKEAAAANT